MNLKKLTQAVFEGLPSEYRWAAVDAEGIALVHIHKPELYTKRINPMWCSYADSSKYIGSDYDPADWQNSLIERQDVPTKADIDWANAPEGATHYSPETDATHAVFYKDDFKQMWIEQWSNLGWQEAHSLNEHERPIFIPQKLDDVARSIEAARVEERDAVNNPTHYTTGGIECIDAMQAMLSREEFIGYLRGNIFKYQWRYKHKNGVEDLRKADWYAQRLIEMECGK